MISNALRIQGWMSERELTWLAETAQKSNIIIEIGSYLGRSTTALCDNTSGKVYSVDPYEGNYRYDDGRIFRPFDDETMRSFHSNLKHHFESGKLVHFRRHFKECSFPKKSDFIFIDGDHREMPLRNDIFTGLEWLKSGGILAGHDYTHSDWPSVKKVVDEMFPQAEKVDSIWWIQKY